MKVKVRYIQLPQGNKKEIFLNADDLLTFTKIFNTALYLETMIVIKIEVV